MNMLKRFLKKTDEDNSYLFDGLKISEAGEKYRQYVAKYPVISISLKGMKQPTYENALVKFKRIISDEFRRHNEVMKSDKLFESDIE